MVSAKCLQKLVWLVFSTIHAESTTVDRLKITPFKVRKNVLCLGEQFVVSWNYVYSVLIHQAILISIYFEFCEQICTAWTKWKFSFFNPKTAGEILTCNVWATSNCLSLPRPYFCDRTRKDLLLMVRGTRLLY